MTKRILKMLIVFLVLMLTFVCSVQAGLTKKTVEAEGIGITLNQAIYDALDEAIGRINGKSIESRKQLESVEVSKIDGDKEDYFASESYQSKIKSATKGVVDSYELLSKSKGNDGLYQVTLSVTVLKFKVKNDNRKRIAVMPMRIGQGRFQINNEPVNKQRVGSVVTQNLVTTLVQSRRFTVLDREYMAETVGEKNLIMSPNAPVAEMARLGQELVADYIMVGTIEDLGYMEQKVKMQSSGRELMSREGYVELSIRLIDVATRQVAFADFLRLRVTGFDGRSINEGVDASIAVSAADQIGRKILDTIYPLVVVSVNGDNLTLGQGGSQIKLGEQLEVFMYGRTLTDPYTKESLGREETKVGSIEITRVNPKQSHARILESSIDIGAQFEPKKFICRLNLDAPDKKEVKREERRKKRDEKGKKRDSDW